MPTKKKPSPKTAAKKSARKTVKKTATTKSASKTATKKKSPGTAVKGAAKKAAPKETSVKKAATPKKASAKKAPAKKASAKKKADSKKTAAKKAVTKKTPPAKKKAATGKSAGKATGPKKGGKTGTAPKGEPSAGSGGGGASEEVTRRVTEALRKRGQRGEEDESRKGQPVVFSLKDLREYLKTRKTAPVLKEEAPNPTAKKGDAGGESSRKAEPAGPARAKQSFGAASVADLLGFDPSASGGVDKTSKASEEGVPKKFLPYFRSLVRLHDEVLEGLNRHSEETLRRSNKEDSGDLSSYGQHMADAGTDSFDRDFALSMVSSEQEALYEIDEAIRRIREGNYGVCEITGKPISRERLKAVPFTRYSVEGQREIEQGRRRVVQQKAGIQGFDGEDSPVLSDEDADE